MTIRFGIAGTGWVAGEYVRSIEGHPDAELGGMYSRQPQYAEGRLKEWGVQARLYGTFEEMAEDPAIDAIVLCSTPEVRPEQAIVAARRGKHLVIEKPVALERGSLAAMEEAIRSNGVKTVTSFVLRWNPLFETVKSLLKDDAIGQVFMAETDYWHDIGPRYVQYRWSSRKDLGGSSILSAGCHAVDALRYFAGEVEEVKAYSCRTLPASASGYEFDPNVMAIMKLRNGGIAKVSSSLECRTPYKMNIRLLGDKGTLLNNQLFSHKFPGQTDYATIPTILPDSGDVTHHPFAFEIADLITAIRSGGTTRCDFEDACRTMELCFAIDDSAASGETIRLPEVRK